MKVSGFTIVRNAVQFDYPVVESITSILPLCDEFIVAVGNSADGTKDLIASLNSSKIKILDTVWDDSLRIGGHVLATETNKAMDAVSSDCDWAIYLQADEVVHEKYLGPIRNAMEKWIDHTEVEGLLFDYLHFWGSYDFIGDSRKWYRKEVRIIRNDKLIRSYRDAQGFRKNGKKLRVALAGATVSHYGWVKPPESQQAKQESFNRYWHDDQWMENKVPKTKEFDYYSIGYLAPFRETHPEVMKDRIARKRWEFNYDPRKGKHSMKDDLLHFIENKTGWRIGEYKNYRL
ncbi:MAG: glycosyltransferase family 2 protein [Bacteroidota bacterium]